MAHFSPELRNAVKCARQRQYKLAQQVGVHPSTLSGWLNRITPVERGDVRVVKLARLVGVDEGAAFSGDDDNEVSR